MTNKHKGMENDPKWLVGDWLQKYMDVCREASERDEVFRTFKSDPRYTPILEHASREIGAAHIDRVYRNNPRLLESMGKFLVNDLYGSPRQVGFFVGDKHFRCSPTTMQYVGVLSNLVDRLGSLDGMRICEIGGGYGGQCKIVFDVFTPSLYRIIDIPEARSLQERYLSAVLSPENRSRAECLRYDMVPMMADHDLVISNYALTEIRDPLQTWYVDNVLMHSKHGYITCNGAISAIGKLREKFPSMREERDIEGEPEGNAILSW